MPPKDKCDRFGNYDANDFECELCDQAEACQSKSPAKKKSKKKTEKSKKKTKPAPAPEAAPAPTKKSKKKPTAEQKKAAIKKLAEKKKKPLKIKPEKTEKVKKKVKKVLAKTEEKKLSTKEALAKAEEFAAKIDALKDKARTSFVNLVMKAAPLMIEAQEILSVDDFDKWCRERIKYERSVCIRYIKAYKTFKDKPELLESIDGQYKLFAVLAHPTPVAFLEKNQKRIADQTSREFRENVMQDRAKVLGDDDPGKKDPVEVFVKFVKNQTTSLQNKFQDAKKLAKRKSLVLDAGAQEALKLNLEEMNEWIALLKDMLKSGKGKK